ncbi:MAG: alpha/beta fold hydrolase [Acidimicrobiales bacterium]
MPGRRRGRGGRRPGPALLPRADREPPLPPPLPPGRLVDVAGRGEMMVRETAAPPGAPTIVMLHGWALGADLNWFRAYRTVAAHGRVVAADLRGHGRSLRSEQPFTLDAAADDVAGLLDHLRAAPAVVVGYSMGGSVALLLWRRHPQCVAGLVLQSTALQWRTSLRDRAVWSALAGVDFGLRLRPPRGITERYLRRAVAHCPELAPQLSWLQAEIRRGDPASIAAAGRALGAFDARSFARRVDVPTAVIVSTRDRLVRPARQRQLARAIPGARQVALDAAHNGWMVRPAEVSRALDAALGIVIGRARGPQTPERSVAGGARASPLAAGLD